MQLADGRELIDGIASWWTACHGYGHPHILKKVAEQLEKLKPGTAPLLLPTIPASDGPILFSSGFVEWQAAQWAEKTVLPAVGSPAANAVEVARTLMSRTPALIG